VERRALGAYPKNTERAMGPPGGFEKERMRKREGIVPLLLISV
jgi:hypothetical protein